MGKENEEWLRSLTDRQLAEEIQYCKLLADGPPHTDHYKRELEEARKEQKQRSEKT